MKVNWKLLYLIQLGFFSALCSYSQTHEVIFQKIIAGKLSSEFDTCKLVIKYNENQISYVYSCKSDTSFQVLDLQKDVIIDSIRKGRLKISIVYRKSLQTMDDDVIIY